MYSIPGRNTEQGVNGINFLATIEVL